MQILRVRLRALRSIITPSKKRYRGVVISTENIYSSISHLSVSEIGSRGDSELRRRSLNYDDSNLYRAITRAIAAVRIYISSLIEIRPTYVTFVACLFLSFCSRFTYPTSMTRVILSRISRIFRGHSEAINTSLEPRSLKYSSQLNQADKTKGVIRCESNIASNVIYILFI